ncbi:hypothetical protein G9C98_001782, partial [Cotesia typhae]
MRHGKTAIFLFFLIIGTSVFPNGSSTGLTSAKSFNPLPFYEGATQAWIIIDKLMHEKEKPNEEPASNIIYGAVTNNKDNHYNNERVAGTLSFGSTLKQEDNYFGGKSFSNNSND